MIFLYLTILTAVTFIGYNTTKKFAIKLNFFNDWSHFLNTLENQITFSKDSIRTIVSKNIASYRQPFASVIQTYFLQDKSIVISDIFSDKQKSLIINFLQSAGKLDTIGEVANIKHYKLLLSREQEAASADYQKYGSMGTKLGFIAGLLICIVLL